MSNWDKITASIQTIKSGLEGLSTDLTPLRTRITPTETEFYGLKDGVWHSQPGWINKNACLHFNLLNYASVNYGTHFRLSFRRRSKYPPVGNLKTFRMWTQNAGTNFGYPDFYVGVPDVSKPQWLAYNELLDPVDGKTRFYLKPWPCGDDKWHDEVYEWQYPTAMGLADGKLKFTCDGVTYLETATWQCDSLKYPGVPNWLCIQDNQSRFGVFPGDSYVMIDPDIRLEILQ